MPDSVGADVENILLFQAVQKNVNFITVINGDSQPACDA